MCDPSQTTSGALRFLPQNRNRLGILIIFRGSNLLFDKKTYKNPHPVCDKLRKYEKIVTDTESDFSKMAEEVMGNINNNQDE